MLLLIVVFAILLFGIVHNYSVFILVFPSPLFEPWLQMACPIFMAAVLRASLFSKIASKSSPSLTSLASAIAFRRQSWSLHRVCRHCRRDSFLWSRRASQFRSWLQSASALVSCHVMSPCVLACFLIDQNTTSGQLLWVISLGLFQMSVEDCC
jgi:hypothetical protein